MDNKLCQIHNEPVLFCEKDAQQKQIFMCRFCIQQRFNFQNIDDVDNEQKQALKQLESKCDQSINQLKEFADQLEKYTQFILQKLRKFKSQLEQNISNLIERKNLIKNKSNDFTSLVQHQINEEENIINNQFSQIKQQLENQLKELEISIKLDQLYKQFNNLSIDSSNQDNKQVQTQKLTVFNKKFNYQLMQQSSYKYNEYCQAIAFNKDSSLMIASCKTQIKVFEFKDDKLREVQKLNGDSNSVACLYFMRKSNQFISAGCDLNIWEQNQNNQWQNNQVIKAHSKYLTCITMNQNEDILISGSQDKTIKFWNKQNNIWSSNQSINCQSSVWSISLNDQENKLIASLDNKQILVIQQQGKKWIVQQKISVEQEGVRLCYINNDQFVFQPFDRQHLLIFDYDFMDQIYKKRQELQYQNKVSDGGFLFPICYISQIGLIIVKNDYHVYLIKRSQDGQFTVEQSINFNTNGLYGSITDDGRYIATINQKRYKQESFSIEKLQNIITFYSQKMLILFIQTNHQNQNVQV